MPVTISSQDETVELDLCLMVSDRGILGSSESVSLLPDRVDQAKVVAIRIEGIEVVPVSYISLEVLVAEPQYGGENLAQAGGVASIIGHNILAFGLPPVLGAVRIVVHIFVAWFFRTIEDLWMTSPDCLARLMVILNSCVSRHYLIGILEHGWSKGTKCRASQVLWYGTCRLAGMALLKTCIYHMFLFVEAWFGPNLVGYGSCSTLLVCHLVLDRTYSTVIVRTFPPFHFD